MTRYPQQIIEQAQQELARRREEARLRQSGRRQQVAQRCPQALQLERQLLSTSAQLARAVLEGGNLAGKVAQLRSANLDAQRQLAGVLQAAGFPEDALQPVHTCPQCRDTGFTPTGPCSCYRQLLCQLMLRQLEQSSPVGSCSFENFSLEYYSGQPGEGGRSDRQVMADILATCREYARAFTPQSGSLLLMGGTGLGKTHLSLAIAREVVLAGYTALYTPYQTLVTQLEGAKFGRTAASYEQLADEAAQCQLLVLDDLGAEFSNAFSVAALYELVNARLIARRPTLISTNLSPGELEARYTARLSSRIFGTYRVLPFVGADVRLQQRRRQLSPGAPAGPRP